MARNMLSGCLFLPLFYFGLTVQRPVDFVFVMLAHGVNQQTCRQDTFENTKIGDGLTGNCCVNVKITQHTQQIFGLFFSVLHFLSRTHRHCLSAQHMLLFLNSGNMHSFDLSLSECDCFQIISLIEFELLQHIDIQELNNISVGTDAILTLI